MEGFDIEIYMQTIKQELLNTFGDELVYLGLQGSFRRGEARESSDIDVMVILEEFTVERMAEYREILKRVGKNVENQPECIGRLSVHSASPRSTGS